jgi:two-component system, NarL family, nitrate/nitrite response regulator NarL
MPKLTPREAEVAGMVSRGGTNRQIAGKLQISEQTVKNQLNSIYRKLHVSNRIQLTRALLLNSSDRQRRG